ncbi:MULTISPECIES: ABC transporter permease [unclassified Mesorhizobium]|uniref:ABC transporter permease n=1 Tax=unclassified Mesorhizobium TaxID=325217 RepID=UPI0009699FD0|nr:MULTISPECIES: ABC transporter permease [unclassified Mesorhizobium]MBN9256052.1 ABC transporter permease [Mesorhizobium sp.]OJX83601.1 MAG: peptide ABC transporter permease [Mesorhizobium sp. 65-26]
MLWRHVIRRSALGVFTLFLISLIIFFATNVLPGDAARAILGRSATPEAVAMLKSQLGMDRPLSVQYLAWMGGILHLDMGMSFISRGPVWDIVAPRLMNTLLLLAATSLVALPVSFVIGTVMAIKPGRLFDNAMNGFLIGTAGIPEFVIAIILVLLLSTQVFHLLPSTALVPPGQSVLENPQVLVLPVLTLTFAVMPYLGRLIRASLMDALASEYVVTARLKGLSPRVVLLRHAMRNSLVPSIQAAALTLAYILGGAVVVEFIFQYPGLGSALQSAVAQRDVFVIQAIVLIFAFGYIAFNMVADILTILMTPRLRS